MAVEIYGGVTRGVHGQLVRVEVDLLRRLPSVSIVGLANHAIKESTERVRSAIVTCGFEFPRMRVVVNLAPANLPKQGTALDLPIAIGILAAHGQIKSGLEQYIFAGELSLSGCLRPISGALALAEMAKENSQTLVLPLASAKIAKLIPGCDVIGAESLSEVLGFLSGQIGLRVIPKLEIQATKLYPDLAEVKGQSLGRRALEIAAAGGHHVLFSGPPGCGKSMLAQRLPGIMPQMTPQETLDCLRLRDLSDPEDPNQIYKIHRPFRAPHHTSSTAALIGDRRLRPGEISLAHHGVLFLDEAPEFSRSVLEALREPLEDRKIRVSRAAGSVSYPASFILVLAANPCPCGFRYTHKPCTCSDSAVFRYQNKLSGPLLDRIDLHVFLRPTPASKLFSSGKEESSQIVRERVRMAREFLRNRDQHVPNALLPPQRMREHWSANPQTLRVLHESVDRLGLSARAAIRLLKVARTIADLSLEDEIQPRHMTEAIGFRPSMIPV